MRVMPHNGKYSTRMWHLDAFWEHALPHLSFDDVCRCRLLCADVRAVLGRYERVVAHAYAVVVLGDAHFWERAARRPAHSARPLGSLHRELVRLHSFRRAVRAVCTVRAPDIYALWTVIDREVE